KPSYCFSFCLVEPPCNIGSCAGEQFPVLVDVQDVMTASGFRELEDLTVLPIDFHVPAVGFVRNIAILRPDPQRTVAEPDGSYLAEMVPSPQVLTVQIEALQPGVVPIRHI